LTLALVALLATARYWHLFREESDQNITIDWMPSPGALAAVVVGALAACTVQVAVATLIARRPLPSSDDADADAANHAIRSAAIMSLTGCSLMTASLTASIVMMRVSAVAGGQHDVFSNLHGPAHVVALLGVLVGWGLSMRSIPRFLPALGGENRRTATST
jgi:hypothetical protein